MGAFWISRGQTISTLSEMVGYKTGLALNRSQILRHLSRQDSPFGGRDSDGLRLRSEEFEDLLSRLLYAVGSVSSPISMPPGIAMMHRYKHDPELLQLSGDVASLFLELWPAIMDEAVRAGKKMIDPAPYVKAAETRFGIAGARMAIEFVSFLTEHQQHSPWQRIKHFDLDDVRALDDLFRSENLESQSGEFFDQRFVDYLGRNFDEVDDMHWRQFEGLTAEFFDRLGFAVRLGPGRSDGGVDIRVWPREADETKPPAMLIQCKRQKAAVPQIVVKALYADVVHEGANAGLIVTTSRLEKGAVKVASARSYPISEANRDTLKIWLDALKSPGNGVYMGW